MMIEGAECLLLAGEVPAAEAGGIINGFKDVWLEAVHIVPVYIVPEVDPSATVLWIAERGNIKGRLCWDHEAVRLEVFVSRPDHRIEHCFK